MQSNSIVLSTPQQTMNTSSLEPHRITLAAVANVRANIEREFSALLEEQPHVLRLALNEAEAVAWQTGFPQLVFPTLAMEKARGGGGRGPAPEVYSCDTPL